VCVCVCVCVCLFSMHDYVSLHLYVWAAVSAGYEALLFLLICSMLHHV